MTTVSNTSKQPLGLPSGIVVPPRGSALAPSWASDSQNRVVQAWLRGGILVVGKAAPVPIAAPVTAQEEMAAEAEAEAEVEAEEDAEAVREQKDKLIAKLAKYGITKDRRSSVETLQAELAEAKKAAAGK